MSEKDKYRSNEDLIVSEYEIAKELSLSSFIYNKYFKDLDLNYVVIILVAFSQGVVGLSDLALSYFYKDELHLQPFEVTRIVSLSSLPWIIKPVYGFISDTFPVFGSRRKAYLIIFGLISTCCWISMSFLVHSVKLAMLTMIINQISNAFCNVIGEALVVETSQKQKQKDPEAGAKNVSLYFMVKAIGNLVSAFWCGELLAIMTKRKIFLITSTFPLILVISSIVIKETPQQNYENGSSNENGHEPLSESQIVEIANSAHPKSKCEELKGQISIFCTFLKLEQIYKPVIFIFLYMSTPSYGDPLFFFYTNVLKFSPQVMGRLRLIYGLASVTGIYIFNTFLRKVGFKKIILSTTLLSIFFNMLSVILVTRFNLKLGIPDFVFCMAADALTTALAEVNSMPLLVIACNVCPKNMEGTIYAFLLSVLNCGSLVSGQFGALLSSLLKITSTDFRNLPWLIIISNCIILLPMPSLYIIDEGTYAKTPANEEQDKNKNNNTEKQIEQPPQHEDHREEGEKEGENTNLIV